MRIDGRLLVLGFTFCGIGCAGGDRDPQPPILPPAGGIVGQALLFDGLDHANTRVILSADGSTSDAKGAIRTSLRFSTLTNAAGGFELKDVPAGTYVATFDHDTYAGVTKIDVVVGDPSVGKLDLGRVVLTRASLVAGGQDVVPGNKAPNAERQMFVIDGQMHIYDQASGALLPVRAPAVGGSFTADGKFALLATGTQASPSASDTLYIARLDGIPSRPIEAPILVSSNALGAGTAANGSRAFVLTPNGNGSNVDLWTLSFSDPSKLTQAATNLPLGALTSIPDPAFPQTGAYTVPVYKQLAYDDNPRIVGGVTVHDFNVFDVSAGTVTKLANVEATSTLPLPSGAPAGTVATRLIRTLADSQATARDLYLFTPGGSPPAKINTAPLPAGLSVDATSADGRAYVMAPDTNGGTAVSAFDIGANPNFRSIIPALLWPATSLKNTLATHGRKTTGSTYLALARSGAGVDLVAIDVAAAKVTAVQSAVTRAFGSAITSSDDLNSSAILRPLANGRYAFNTAASATQLTPGVIDANGAHVLSGTFDNAAFSSLTVSTDGTAAAFLTATTSVGVAKIPAAAGAIAPTMVTTSAVPTLLSVSANGAVVAYAVGNSVTTMTSDGQSAAIPLTTTALSFSKVWVDSQAVVAVDANGQAMAGKVGVAASGVNLTTGAYSASCLGFADGSRVLVHNGSSTLLEVDPTQATVAIANTYSASTSSVVMNGARTRAFILGSGLTALRSDGSKDAQTGSWSLLPITSPNGKEVYFRDTSGKVIAYGEAGAPVDVATNLAGTSTDYLRPLNAGADFVFIDSVNGHYDLVATHADTGARTVVVANLVAQTPIFDSAPGAALRPWTTADGNTVFGLGDTAPTTAGSPSTPKVRLAAYTTSALTIGENVATTPPPALDAARTSLVFQTDKESQFGTATYMSYPLGGTAAVVVAQNVRTYAASPDGKSIAAIVIKDGHLQLQSGPVGQPTVAMGALDYSTLNASNLVFSDDGQRLFTFDVASTGSIATTGMLWTGAVGAQGLTAVTLHALGVFPDKSGKQAAVLTRNVDESGRILSRFVAP